MARPEASAPRVRTALRILGHLWASPLTVAGVLVALAGGARAAGLREGAVDLVAPRRGPLAGFFRRARVVAFTWGAAIVYRDAGVLADPRLRRHERAHVRQALGWGPLLALAYPASSLWQALRGRRAYHDNAFEVAARAAEVSAPGAAGRPGASSGPGSGSSA
jgi:hypothetical protein